MVHNVGVLVSGGKDSILSLWIALHKYNVTSILNIVPKKDDSQLFHYENSEYVGLISNMLGLKFYSAELKSNNIHEELTTLTDLILKSGVKAIVTGGVLSEFQRFKFNRAAKLANVNCYNPIWRKSPEGILNLLINNNFEVIIVSVSSMGLHKNLIGKSLTLKLYEHLKNLKDEFGLSIIGEGGEFETFVLDAPFFPKKLVIEDSEILWDDKRDTGWLKINELNVIKKNR